MTTFPPGWQFYTPNLARRTGWSERSIRRWMAELIRRGYVVREQARDTAGAFATFYYMLCRGIVLASPGDSSPSSEPVAKNVSPELTSDDAVFAQVVASGHEAASGEMAAERRPTTTSEDSDRSESPRAGNESIEKSSAEEASIEISPAEEVITEMDSTSPRLKMRVSPAPSPRRANRPRLPMKHQPPRSPRRATRSPSGSSRAAWANSPRSWPGHWWASSAATCPWARWPP